MKNVTISLDEGLLKAARLAAAKAGVSFQEFVRQVLRRETAVEPSRGLKEFWDMADKLNARADGKYLTREEIHDREGIRRQQRLSVRERPGSRKKKDRG